MRKYNNRDVLKYRPKPKTVFTYFEFLWIIIVLCVFCYFYDENEGKSKRGNQTNVRSVQFLPSKSLPIKNVSANIQNRYWKNVIINYNIHVFYYAWYANPEIDGEFRHWNHKYVPAWEQNDQIASPVNLHYPPIDIGSNYYPTFGCYSSSDPNIINMHMKLIQDAGIGVVAISWKPPNYIDSPYNILQSYFDIAEKYKIKITIHIEHYRGRNPINLKEHLRIFLNRFGNHPSLYKVKKNKKKRTKRLPLIYIYDSYLISETRWEEIFGINGQLTIRNTEIDGIFIGLLADIQHRNHIKNSKFDGFYTYFGANDFTYGSTWENWKALSEFANTNKLIFIPSVSPGYIDTRVRPWHADGIKYRQFGEYYNVSWRKAIDAQPQYISITSFNDWHEGTQIEPASPKVQSNFESLHYEPYGPYFYIRLTKEWISKLM